MAKPFLIALLFFTSGNESNSQSSGTRMLLSSWDFNVSSDLYFYTDDFLVIPVFKGDKNKLHLETRYNYEGTGTVSFWGGYNFQFGKKLTFTITPMAAPVLGNINGIAPGLELTINYGKFEVYSESEYLFDLEDKNSNFFYNWSEISFSPLSFCSAGLAAQRTLAYNDDNKFQAGLSAGLSYKIFGAYIYYFNIGKENDFFMMSAEITF